MEDTTTPGTPSINHADNQNLPYMEKGSSISRTQSIEEDVSDQDLTIYDCHPLLMRDIYLMKKKWGEKSVDFLTVNDLDETTVRYVIRYSPNS